MAREITHEATGPKPTDEDDFGDDTDGWRREIEESSGVDE